MEAILKQIKTLPHQKELFSLLLIAAFSLLIWFCGPLIAIANSVPLEQPEKRFYIISLMFIAWFVRNYFFNPQPRVVPIPFVVPNLDLVKKIQALEEKFAGFIDFLKKTIINKQGSKLSLVSLPWYLVIGPSGSGKTSLLANANVNFLLSKKFKTENMRQLLPSGSCDWWVTRDLVLVDVPGAYLSTKEKKPANAKQIFPQSAPGDVLWRSLVNLLKKFRGVKALSGIVITLSLPDLMSQHKQTRENSLLTLKQRITELRTQFGENLPFYLTITKCDVLPGFMEFFSDSGMDETSQMWGVSIPALKEGETLNDVFSNRFGALVKRLNSQLICRLHQERNPIVRPYIKDFPLHIERLKASINNFIKSILAEEKGFHLQGVYLTSAVQSPVEENMVQTHSTSLVTQKFMPAISTLPMPTKPYFIRQLLLHGLVPIVEAKPVNTPTRTTWQHRPIAYTISVVVILTGAFFLGVNLRHNLKQTYAIQDGLNQFQSETQQKDVSIANALPLLDALEETVNSSRPWFFQSDKAEKNAQAAYQSALQKIIFSEIKNDLETYLQNTYYKNPDDIYTALKAYLMLDHTERLQPDFLINTLQQVTPALFSNQNADKITHHLRAALNSKWQSVELNDDLINSVRKHLINQSSVELAYVILKNLAVSLHVPDTDTNLQSYAIKIPGMLTAGAFQNIYNEKVEQAAGEATEGNAVLGKISNPSTQNSNALIEQLRNLYVTNYAAAWENLLSHTQISSPKNLEETDALVSSLASDNSPLLQLLRIIKQNTNYAPVANVSPKLAGLNVFLNSGNADSAFKIAATLQHLHVDLQKILGASDPGNAAFQAAASRMLKSSLGDPISELHNISETSPEPLKSWIGNIAFQSWHFTLQEAGRYIETRWQTDIMKVYREQFAGRFPFALESSQETPLDQFTKMLNPQGSLMTFYQKYLQPFVDNSDKKLQWKKVENDQIPFSPLVLNQFQQAQLLQSIFFPDIDSKLSIKFTLQPVSLATNTKSITINIDGQSLQYDRGQPRIPQNLVWPGNRSSHMTRMDLMASNNHPINSSTAGDWGWFRLVSTSVVKTVNSRELLLNFDVYGYQAKYYLFTHQAINPFLVLQDFKLPEQL